MRNLANNLLERPLGQKIKHELELRHYLHRRRFMLKQLSTIPIVGSGIEALHGRQVPFVVLERDVVLFGRLPTDLERQAYSRWKDRIVLTICEDAIQVAMDVVLRYLYPHAMPQLTMPYTLKQRHAFHKQHCETISDLPGLSGIQKRSLQEKFSIKKGESFLDVGAYMGYGTIRMARELGPDSQIIAVEADPDTLWLLEQNIRANNLSNVKIIPKAVSNQDGTAAFFKTGRQANSLISEVVSSENFVDTPVTTIDSISKEAAMTSVNRISITINGAEVEAVEGMKETVERSNYTRISMAGWYKRGGQRIADIVAPVLRSYGLNVAVGREGGVLAWKDPLKERQA